MNNLPSKYCLLERSFNRALNGENRTVPYLLRSAVVKGQSTQVLNPALYPEHNCSAPLRSISQMSAVLTVRALSARIDRVKTTSERSLKSFCKCLQTGRVGVCAHRLCSLPSSWGACRESLKSFQIVRPLLSCSRDSITALCKHLKVPVYPDRTNQSVHYSRNRIRKQILPSIQIFLNPQVEDALFAFAQLVSQEQDMVSDLICATQKKRTE